MKRLLILEIDCGNETCYSVPGKFCPKLRVSLFGTRWHCGVFDLEEVHTPKDKPEGWLQRLPACLTAEQTRRCRSCAHYTEVESARDTGAFGNCARGHSNDGPYVAPSWSCGDWRERS